MRSFAIVPAAGRSKRMRVPKLLLSWRGRPLLEHVLDAWRASRVDRVVLVVHPDDDEIATIGRAGCAEVVVPELPPEDMKASVLYGLEFIEQHEQPTSHDVWLVAPADMPRLPTSAINAVLDAHDQSRPRIIVPRYESRRGHPVLFPWKLAVEVEELAPKEGINRLLTLHEVHEIELSDRGILVDIDTKEDFDRLEPL